MFEVARFVADCDGALAGGGGREAVREILQAAVADPAAIIAALGEPKRAGVQVLHRSPRLSILQVAWVPSYTQTPHSHLMWAEIGVYSGREDNIFWRRLPPGAKWPIEAIGGASICAGTCRSLEDDVIHSLTNPLDRVTGALHVYGGDLPGAPRSMWDGETLAESLLDHARDYRAIDAYNARFTD
jgi:predicted metal-dependent enzyme (double-stranded beta helix superfamily)